MTTDWLPALVLVEDDNGDWTRYLQRVYAFFQQDFVASLPPWPGKRMGLKRHPEYDGKSATFWHFISEGAVEADRYPDPRRCERIRWPRPVIESYAGTIPSAEDRIVWWKNTRGKEINYVLALPDFSYIVVMADRGDYVLPKTAYVVERSHSRAKLQKEHAAYWLS